MPGDVAVEETGFKNKGFRRNVRTSRPESPNEKGT
jgi:hypothetical protein